MTLVPRRTRETGGSSTTLAAGKPSPRAFSLVAAGRLDPRPLTTHRFPLDELPQALEMSVRRPAGFLKALVISNDRPPRARGTP